MYCRYSSFYFGTLLSRSPLVAALRVSNGCGDGVQTCAGSTLHRPSSGTSHDRRSDFSGLACRYTQVCHLKKHATPGPKPGGHMRVQVSYLLADQYVTQSAPTKIGMLATLVTAPNTVVSANLMEPVESDRTAVSSSNK